MLPHIHKVYRNINLFPFPAHQLVTAVRTNLLLADLHCQETLALTVTWILTMLRSYYHQDSHYYSIHHPFQESFYSSSTPAYHSPCGGL